MFQFFLFKHFRSQHQLIAHDCTDIMDQGFNQNYGTYIIKPPDKLVSFEVVCDLTTERGGWIVFQKRYDGSEDFYRPWKDYKNGFGDLTGEHWLGLEKLHRLTRNGVWQLRVELEDFNDNTAYAEYSSFAVGDEGSNYSLTVGTYSGTAGTADSLTHHKNRPFSTYDRDLSNNCATNYKGGWWYDNCYDANLNGLYLGSPSVGDPTGIVWEWWTNRKETLKKAEMKMRRIW